MGKRKVGEATTLPDPKCWELPIGWSWVPFSDAAIIASNLVKPTQVSHLPHIAPDNIESRTGRLLPYRSIAEDGVISAKHRFTAGQVLYSKIRPYLRKAVVADFEGACSADMYPLTPKEGVSAGYLHRWLISEPFAKFTIEHEGRTVLPKINQEGLNRTWIPLPPVTEQCRIVAKLDSLSSTSKRAREHLDHIPRLVEKYKQAVLAAAFRGQLTRQWRERHRVADWSNTTVGEQVTKIVAGKNLRCEERPPQVNERGVVKVSAVTWGTFDPSASKTLPASFEPPEDTRIGLGDLLISRANTLELVGAVVLVHAAPANLYLSDKILRLEMENANKGWLMWFLRSPGGREAIERAATGNQLSMRNLSQQALKSIRMPWPEAVERVEIERRVSSAFSWIDRLATEATSARTLIDRLDQAVLAKAFRGDLVPQDPNDEPASVLLERIRVEREAAPAVKARRGRATRS